MSDLMLLLIGIFVGLGIGRVAQTHDTPKVTIVTKINAAELWAKLDEWKGGH